MTPVYIHRHCEGPLHSCFPLQGAMDHVLYFYMMGMQISRSSWRSPSPASPAPRPCGGQFAANCLAVASRDRQQMSLASPTSVFRGPIPLRFADIVRTPFRHLERFLCISML